MAAMLSVFELLTPSNLVVPWCPLIGVLFDIQVICEHLYFLTPSISLDPAVKTAVYAKRGGVVDFTGLRHKGKIGFLLKVQ